jgi:hypothetical protein
MNCVAAVPRIRPIEQRLSGNNNVSASIEGARRFRQAEHDKRQVIKVAALVERRAAWRQKMPHAAIGADGALDENLCASFDRPHHGPDHPRAPARA